MVLMKQDAEDLRKNEGKIDKGAPLIWLTEKETIDLLQQIEGIRRKLKAKIVKTV